MTDTIKEQFKMVKVIYILFLLMLLFPVTGLVGIIMAHVGHGEAVDEKTKSHYQYQYRTFWIGLVAYLVSGSAILVGIGFLLLFLVTVWWIVRCVKGLLIANKHESMPEPERFGI
jgi:uncharacterized membrane protein